MAAKVGYCGLDRRREPLSGDEVRACWQDGAAPLVPDPAIPGLLDLLTVDRLGVGEVPADVAVAGATPRPQPGRTDGPRTHRLWVEVEA